MSDFSTLLRGYVTEQTDRAQAVALDPAAESRVVAWRARRRRAARVGVVVGAAAAVVIVAGAGVFAATRPDPVPPAETHTPTLTPTPSESPTDDATQEPAVDPGAGPNPLLPESQPLEPGMLAAAGPGSVLVDYQVMCAYPCLQAASDLVLHLVSPDGAVHASTLPHPEGYLRDWLPGSSLAVFAVSQGYDDEEYRVVDVDTGRVLSTFSGSWAGLADTGHVLRAHVDWESEPSRTVLERVSLADGSVVASTEVPGQPQPDTSPDRAHLFLSVSSGVRILQTATLADVTMPSQPKGLYGAPCRGVGWAGSDAVVVECEDGSNAHPYYVPLDGWSVDLGAVAVRSDQGTWGAWAVDGAVVTAQLPWWRTPGDIERPDFLYVRAVDGSIPSVPSDGGPMLGRTSIDWSAQPWTTAAAMATYRGSVPGGIVATGRQADDGASLVRLNPFDGSFTTLLEPRAPGVAEVWAVVVVPSEDGGL